MAAVIGGISRLFQPTIGVLSGEKPCQGISPWYFLIGIRMVTLFFAFGPWESLKADLICQWPSEVGDAKAFCTALCYNQHFPIPISAVWAFHFIAIIFTVALMKFVHITGKDTSAKDVEAAVEGSKPAMGTSMSCEPYGQTTFGGWRYRIFIMCVALILAMELSFIWILLALQSPVMSRGVVMCYPNNPACPPSAQCALNAQSDKQAILWALAFCSAANASVCIGYLATHASQACGGCGSCGSAGKARFDGHLNCGREAVGCGCRCNRPGCRCCQGSDGGQAKGCGYQSCGNVGTEGCRGHPEGATCCCHPGNDNHVACGCQDDKRCLQESEMRQNSLASRGDSEGKLLRGDTEFGGERKEWKPNLGRMQIKEPLRIGAKKGQGSPKGGKPVKYVAKYQAWGKRKV
uniref:Connexin N-terminal domain-containing protein n=1 Tax=Pogona vitticeps TaxID=103695 RepID=A0ABM5EIF7_9SAUR